MLVAALALCAVPAHADGDRAVRRLQMQMQALQQQLQDAQAAQAKAEAGKADSDKKLSDQSAALPKAESAARQAQSALKETEAAKAQALAKVDSLEKALEQARKDQDAVLAAKNAEIDKLKAVQNGQLNQLLGRYEDAMGQYGNCSAKNEKLLQISSELLERYRRKGFAEVLRQRDPVLGLGDVQMFNLVQEYHDRIGAEQLLPAAASHP